VVDHLNPRCFTPHDVDINPPELCCVECIMDQGSVSVYKL
jgi:hypothetical protein